MEFGENLRKIRVEAKLSQKTVAERIGMSQQAYNNYEKRGYNPSIEMLKKLGIALDTDMNMLIGFEPKKSFYEEHNRFLEETLLHLLKTEKNIVVDLIDALEKQGWRIR